MSTLTGPAVLAGDITTWIDDKTNWFGTALPAIFLVVVVGIGVWLLVVTRSIRKTLLFGIGAAVVYMTLTNVDAIGDKFGSEIDGAPARPGIIAADSTTGRVTG